MSVSCMSPTSSTASTTSHHHVLVTHDDILAKLDEEGAAYDTTENSDSLDLKCMVYDLNTDASPFHTVLVCLAASKRVNESAVLARLGLWSAPKSTLTMSTDCEASVGQCPGSIGPLYLPDSEGVVCLITSEVVASHIPIRVSAGHQEYVYLEEPSALLHLVDASEVLLLDVDAWLDLTLQEDLVLFTSNDDPIEVVCTQQQLEPLVALWSAGMTIVSIDSEREPKTQAISLIQVSLYGPHRLRRDFIIDVQLFDDKEYLGRELAELFVSFNSLKILHSATNDLRHFEKNFEACECIRERVNNLLDTQILGSRLGQTKLGLAKLAEE
ncbi:hypothetical protein Pmar_PMAR024154 [Perkinsus marinus ATCC 50983]|uniref:3'-5' exonuclease domain-containing protein n=1 Tax=Perkinsus marinus (strain ATCC 50983 / TXsc) TaxID=423536 RepID=C5L2B8_PERM5|nr:hypothetical protein Pmar_PMAR024154 [Perkinsus marinus ATCC 50983]EER09130.1 hypothetical protein Pmar_PMAR024154 [Perkinsus marinus ATCC 50983]|eukprot:XP_002777314.1 hypothetical protein Pmar_PMAR024154 [Perkinsus marinus ATCC 50983]